VAEAVIARWCAAAVMATPDGRYLMQLRDAKACILLPDHWALFGGSIEPGEAPKAALQRELAEELRFAPNRIEPLTELLIDLPFTPPRRDRMSFFHVPIEERDVAAMVLGEGAAMRLFRAEELALLPRVAPWDLAVVLMHARRASLFGQRPASASS
jgi:8-oxo-dGTP pyrophosphatase MutT (NUDIX family)